MLICAHAYQVNCNRTELYYANNLLIGQKDKHFVNEDPVFFPVGEFELESWWFVGSNPDKNTSLFLSEKKSALGTACNEAPFIHTKTH